jgi:hypothetical protein
MKIPSTYELFKQQFSFTSHKGFLNLNEGRIVCDINNCSNNLEQVEDKWMESEYNDTESFIYDDES